MLTIPGADITPNTRASSEPVAKQSKGKTAEGSTAACLILHALAKRNLNRSQLAALLKASGKNESTAGSTLHVLKNRKHVRLLATGEYAITSGGGAWLAENCK